MIEVAASVTPNNWAGTAVTVATCFLTWVAHVFLYNWDDPEHTKTERARDLVQTQFDYLFTRER